jgi:ABC-type nitrate/sulfonate/bicarbonate transport system substrate-binding protein
MKIPKTRMIVVITILFFVICLGTYAGFYFKNKNPNSGPPEKITIAYSTAFNATLVHIAFAQGFFAEEGLDATPQPHAFGKPALQALIDGNADIATAGDTPIVFAIMNGKGITILATIQTSNKNEGIVARQDRGITKPSDLKGKYIGVTPGTTGDFFADSFLLSQNIERNQVTIVDLKPEEMYAALSTGRVDAVSTWNPTLTQLLKKLGNKACIFYGETLYTETFNVVAKHNFIRDNPETIKKVLRALIKAEAFVQQNPEKTRRISADFIKTDKAILDETWDYFNFRVTLDQSLLIELENQSRWVIKNKWTLRRDMPNYLDYIYIDGLMAIRPDAVRIIR